MWVTACFGPVIAADKTERHHRFLEEALELAQSAGGTASEAHQLVDYVFGRPVGEMGQEIGGVMNTLAALCEAFGHDMTTCADKELERCWAKMEIIRAKQAAKPKHSPLPEAKPPILATDDARGPYYIELDANHMGCDHCGEGKQWLVVGPDEVAESTSYDCKEHAEDVAEKLSVAYRKGRASRMPGPEVTALARLFETFLRIANQGLPGGWRQPIRVELLCAGLVEMPGDDDPRPYQMRETDLGRAALALAKKSGT
jgi:hypothetical protein